MSVVTARFWYVMLTQPRAELKAAGHLLRQGFAPCMPSFLKTSERTPHGYRRCTVGFSLRQPHRATLALHSPTQLASLGASATATGRPGLPMRLSMARGNSMREGRRSLATSTGFRSGNSVQVVKGGIRVVLGPI